MFEAFDQSTCRWCHTTTQGIPQCPNSPWMVLTNAIQLCHPLFITHIFRGRETLQSKKQHTIQAIAMCNLLVISNVCKISPFSCWLFCQNNCAKSLSNRMFFEFFLKFLGIFWRKIGQKSWKITPNFPV